MILSHRRRFIFVKTRKTGGTSLEIALSSDCGPEHIITPVSPEDDQVRKRLAYRGPKNFRLPPWRYGRKQFAQLLHLRRKFLLAKRFWNHMTAREFREGHRGWNLSEFDRDTLAGDVAVDHVILYEKLADEFPRLASTVGLPEVPELPRAKAGHRI